MIETALKTSLERITGLNAYPLLLPDTEQEGATFQRISDPQIGAGLARTGLVAVRIQVTLYLLDNYSRLLQLDKALWDEFKTLTHSELEGYPVQYVQRGGIQQSRSTQTSNRIQYRLARDFTFSVQE